MSSSKGGGRKLSALEQKIHQAALAAPDKTITADGLKNLSGDLAAGMTAANFLLGAGLLKAQNDAKGRLSFRAVGKKELDTKKDMSGEETMVLNHIQAAANEGIWTKHIKAKTELHQTVIDRCLKSLTQKQLVKVVKSVKHPTRKIYMLFHLDPSVEMTGGPWYTDNELDTEFIDLLKKACLNFITERSLPRVKNSSTPTHKRPIYPIGGGPSYPTAQHVSNFVSKSKITETPLTTEHVEMLLNVLVLDGEIEKVPTFGAALWEASVVTAGDEESDDDRKSTKKEKRKKKRKRTKEIDSDASASGSADESRSKGRPVKKKRRDDSDSESGSESDEPRKKHRSKSKSKSKKKRDEASSSSDSSSEDSDDGKSKKRSKSKSKSKHKSKRRRTDDSDSDSDSGSDSKSEDDRRSKSRSKSRKGDFGSAGLLDETFGSLYVYRAIRPERLALFATGLSEAPCGRCPVFEFCKEGGPVNPRGCVYYGDWLERGLVAAE